MIKRDLKPFCTHCKYSNKLYKKSKNSYCLIM